MIRIHIQNVNNRGNIINMNSPKQSTTVANWQPHTLVVSSISKSIINNIKMNLIYAVEHAHDENILTHEMPVDKELYLSFMLSLLTLEPHTDHSSNCDEETLRMRQQLLVYKAEVDALDRNAEDYYQRKEQLIFKIFCEFRGLVYESDLQESPYEYE